MTNSATRYPLNDLFDASSIDPSKNLLLFNTMKGRIRLQDYFKTGEHLTPISLREETNSEVTATWNFVEWNSMLYLVPGS